MHVCARSVTESCPTLCDPMDVAHQVPLSMEFLRKEYWCGLPFPSVQGYGTEYTEKPCIQRAEYKFMRIFNCTEGQHLNPQVVEGSTVYQISFFTVFSWLCITPILPKTLICKLYLKSVKFISMKLYFTKLNNYCGYSCKFLL